MIFLFRHIKVDIYEILSAESSSLQKYSSSDVNLSRWRGGLLFGEKTAICIPTYKHVCGHVLRGYALSCSKDTNFIINVQEKK